MCRLFVRPRFHASVFPLVAALALSWLTLACPALADNHQATVRVGVIQNKPLSFQDAQGRFQGVYPDILAAVAEMEGWKLEYVPGNWSGLLDKLKSGDIDLMISIVKNPQRAELYDFSQEPVVTSWGQVWAGSGDKFSSILDLSGKNVAVMKADINAKNFREMCQRFGLTCRLIEADTYHGVAKLIVSGKADAGVINNLNGPSYEKQYGLFPTPIVFNPVSASFAAPKGENQHLLATLDKFLAHWRQDQDSIYYQILRKNYGSQPGTEAFSLELMLTIAGVIVAIALFFIVWNTLLRRQVRLRTEELSQSERRYRQLFEQATVGIFQSYPQGGVLRVNPFLAAMFGHKNPENVTSAIKDLASQVYVDPNDREVFRQQLTDHGQVRDFECQQRRADGQPIWVSLNARTVTDASGQVEYYEGFVQDITARKMAEEALEESERRYRIVADNTHDWEYWLAPNNQKFLYCSPSCKRITGYWASEFVKDPGLLIRIIHPEDLPVFLAHQDNKNDTQVPGPVEFRIIHQDGSPRWLEHACQPVFADGKHLGVRASNRNITDRKMAEHDKQVMGTRLRRAQKLESLGTLAGGIAHDFNNILASMIGYAELSRDILDEGESPREELGEILQASHRARSLIKQILAFSRQTEQEPQPISLGPIVKEVLKLLRSSLPANIEINQNLAPGSGYALADASQIHQVMMNLCTNAADAIGGEGGAIMVSLSLDQVTPEQASLRPGLEPDKYQVLSISDTGPGIPPEIMEHIFEPYFTTKATGQGTGLGLSVVHGIITGYGGEVRVESQLGHGSTFKVYLPSLEHQVQPVLKVAVKSAPTGSERILLVDDEETLALACSRSLERLGYQVVVKSSADEALQAFSQASQPFDLLITDMTMPGRSGLDLAQDLLQSQPDLPVIICTGYSKYISEEQILDAGIKKLMFKPWKRDDLATTVRQVLDQPDN